MMNKAEWTFSLPDLSCGHCERAVRQAVAEEEAQAQVHVDLSQRRVTITGSERPRERWMQVLTEAGYPPA